MESAAVRKVEIPISFNVLDRVSCEKLGAKLESR